MRPAGAFVVFGVVASAAVQDAHQTVAQGAERLVVGVLGRAALLVRI
jgi:hypothetical protein